jgi:CBS-domain-containing membrane protein
LSQTSPSSMSPKSSRDYDIGGMPVLDPARRLVGVVSLKTDLVDLWASAFAPPDRRALPVRDVVTQPARTIRGSASDKQAARSLTERGPDRPVLGDDTDVALGVIPKSALARTFAS